LRRLEITMWRTATLKTMILAKNQPQTGRLGYIKTTEAHREASRRTLAKNANHGHARTHHPRTAPGIIVQTEPPRDGTETFHREKIRTQKLRQRERGKRHHELDRRTTPSSASPLR
jgi:hypothetical protein